MDSAEQIKNHIAKGRPEEAVKVLLEYTKEFIPDLHDEALLLSGQYRQWKRGITLGVEQSSSELRRIEMGIMDLLNDQETYTDTNSRMTRVVAAPTAMVNPPAKKSNLTSILLGVFGTISFGFILILAIGGSEEPLVVENAANSERTETAVAVSEVAPPKSNKTVFGGSLTEDQFDNMLGNYNKSMAETPQLDLNMVIQVRYTDGEKTAAFESVAGTKEWVERNETTGDIMFRYQELSRENRTITLFDETHKRSRYLSIDDDKVYEKVGDFKKVHVFNIIGVY